ncbi:MAG: lysylphosphatidylglycerol synthase transmembrane domain-containing protein [Desulfomonilaceae bacterium]
MSNLETATKSRVAEPSNETEAGGGMSGIVSARLIRSVLFFTVAGVILYAAATLATGYQGIAASLRQFPVQTLLLVLALVVIGWLLRGWRFYYYLRRIGKSVPLTYSLKAFLAGFALTGTPAKVGEAVKGVFLKEDYGISVTRVVGIVMVERLMDLWGVLLLGSLSLLLFSRWRSLFLVFAGIVIAGGIFICMERVYRPVLEWIGKISFLSWISAKILKILLTGRDLMTPRIFLVGLVVSTLAWGMESLSLYLILKGLHLSSSLLEANFVYCFSTIVGALSMLPGGIGGTEAGMMGLLGFMGISYTESLPAVILIRLCTLWLAVLVGIGFMIFMLARSRNKLRHTTGHGLPLPDPELCSSEESFHKELSA